jgi:YD repeat-containing protein
LLLKVTFGKEGEPGDETVNHYDNKGRLQSVTDSRRPDNPIAFRYDANGRKTRIAIVKPPDDSSGTRAISMSPDAFFEHPEMAPNLPDGGTAVTLYDASDRPTEVQLHDPAGTIVSRMVRVYDDRGNATEERETMENTLTMIPAKQRGEILSKSGMSAQDLRDQLAKFLGAQGELYSSRYSYDKQGRKTLTIRNVFNHDENRTETSYNEHGDVAKETSRSSQTDIGDEQTDTTYSSEVLYSYEYDSNGNWTMKKSTSRSLPDGQPKTLTEVRRTIEYY